MDEGEEVLIGEGPRVAVGDYESRRLAKTGIVF